MIPDQRSPSATPATTHRDHDVEGFVGCPGCLAAGVYLCPGCLRPGPGADGRGFHTCCIPARRWAAFAAFAAFMAVTWVVVIALVVAFPRPAMALFVLAVVAALGWPHRMWALAWLLRPLR